MRPTPVDPPPPRPIVTRLRVPCPAVRHARRAIVHAGVVTALVARIGAAQSVHGQVLEHGTERPLAGARVSVADDSNRVLASATTDSAGTFLLSLPRAGTYALEVRHIGHQPGLSRRFPLARGEEYEPVMYLTLGPAQPMTPIRVTERPNRRSDFTRGFEERRTRGFGEFLSRAQIERRGATTPIELLRGMAGVAFARGPTGLDVPISTRGATGLGNGCRMEVYIDGIALGAQPLEYAIRPSDMEAIEVYATAAEMPAQFKHGNAGCGAILIWSRTP